MSWGRRLRLILLSVGIVAAIVWGYWPRAVLVDAAPVKRDSLSVTVDEEGKTRVIDRYVVSAPVAGYARRIQFDVGDRVQQGQAAVELEPLRSDVLDPRRRAEARAQVAAAEASLDAAEAKSRAARADAEYAAREYERKQRLWKSRTISQEALEAARNQKQRTAADLRSAQFAVDVARHELEGARTALAYSAAQVEGNGEWVQVRSPVAGTVLKLHQKSEGVVQAGQALVEVGDPRALEVVVDLLSADAVRVEPGTRVLFDRWGGEGLLEGVVRVVEPTGFTKISALGIEEQRVWVIADITSPPEKWVRLGDGYRLEASFLIWQQDDVLQIPASALFRYGQNEWAVFVIDDGVARRRAVEVGRNNGLVSQVINGLKEGEIVITHPDDTIEDGTKVKPRPAD